MKRPDVAIAAAKAQLGPLAQRIHCSPESLRAVMGPDFASIATHRKVHRTPAGKPQAFTYGLFRRESEA